LEKTCYAIVLTKKEDDNFSYQERYLLLPFLSSLSPQEAKNWNKGIAALVNVR